MQINKKGKKEFKNQILIILMVLDKKAILTTIDNLKKDLAIFRFRVKGESLPSYKAGQFITIGTFVPSENKIVRRPFTMTSHPENKDYIELYIRWFHNPFLGKVTTQLFNAKKGDEIMWLRPTGSFTINENLPDGRKDERRIVCLGGGTEIAPFISYARHLRTFGDKREIIVFHGAKYVDEFGFREFLTKLENESLDVGRNKWNFRYQGTISRPNEKINESWNGHRGRVGTFLISRDGEASDLEKMVGEKVTPENTSFYLCGYQGTIDSCLASLNPKGFVTERKKRDDDTFEIKYESYG